MFAKCAPLVLLMGAHKMFRSIFQKIAEKALFLRGNGEFREHSNLAHFQRLPENVPTSHKNVPFLYERSDQLWEQKKITVI